MDEITVTRPARVRRTWGPSKRDVIHRVEVGSHTGPAEQALCGARSRAGVWVLEPRAPLNDCVRCLVKENLTR